MCNCSYAAGCGGKTCEAALRCAKSQPLRQNAIRKPSPPIQLGLNAWRLRWKAPAGMQVRGYIGNRLCPVWSNQPWRFDGKKESARH